MRQPPPAPAPPRPRHHRSPNTHFELSELARLFRSGEMAAISRSAPVSVVGRYRGAASICRIFGCSDAPGGWHQSADDSHLPQILRGLGLRRVQELRLPGHLRVQRGEVFSGSAAPLSISPGTAPSGLPFLLPPQYFQPPGGRRNSRFFRVDAQFLVSGRQCEGDQKQQGNQTGNEPGNRYSGICFDSVTPTAARMSAVGRDKSRYRLCPTVTQWTQSRSRRGDSGQSKSFNKQW